MARGSARGGGGRTAVWPANQPTRSPMPCPLGCRQRGLGRPRGPAVLRELYTEQKDPNSQLWSSSEEGHPAASAEAGAAHPPTPNEQHS